VIHIVTNKCLSHHVSEDTVKEFEKVILSDPQVQSAKGERWTTRALGAFFWRCYERALLKPDFLIRNCLSLPISGEYLSVLMGLRFRKCMPYFAFSKRKHLYMFDAWSQYHDKIRDFVNLCNISSLFLSSRQAVVALQEDCQCPVHWIPEGIDPSAYRYADYQNKNIDVIEFGRKSLTYHNAICENLVEQGRVHLYEKNNGELIFPTREAFIDGLARSKISICIPSNITHPERAGSIETMTIRYLQSIVSKCLIIGHAPLEMVDLFGYNPVLEIDHKNPLGQLTDVLERYEDFIPLIEQNHKEVLTHHTWVKRWEEITLLLSEYRLLPGTT